MRNFNRINARDLRLGMKFSAPVFFDDGENMFLAENRSVKAYHLAVIKKWDIDSLLTYGHLLVNRNDESFCEDEFEYELEELEEVKAV